MAEHHRTCSSCGTTNEEDARFCEGCGGALGRACGTCGVEANSTARFCRACGAPLDGQVGQTPEAAGPSRKTVTVMFADLAGSTTFEEQVDAETAREVMSRYHDLLRFTAERNRAGVTKYIGDGFMAVWGVPEIGPDDAGHAVDAAVELQEHFVEFAARTTEVNGVELALRVAVNTGEVVVGAGDADLVGDALNVGARLEAECPRGCVVVGEETWRSTRGRHRYDSLGHVQVKGRTAPVPVYQWLGRQSESTDATPFVGRTDEIHRLAAALDDAVAAQTARLVTVIGDPGVGKSRLAAEFVGTLRDGRVIRARCDVEATVALAPIVEVLRGRDLDADVPIGVSERDRILRDLNGLTAGIPGSVEETFWALRRFVEVLARDGPLVIVVDDIHWADTLLLDFVEHLAEWVQEVPVLVLALARPELREVRADLVTVSRWVSEAVHLGGLDPGATAELAAGVLGTAPLPEELLGRLPSSTGGNPLFVRELVGMLVHDGVLVAEPGGWRLTIDVDAIAIPPTIQALLASRLERLNASDRRVLEIASVIGTDFSLDAVCALAGRGSPEVKGSLDRLRRLDLAQPSGAYLGDEPVWRFHHVLIRDVAYRRLLKSDRADLHNRLADWVESGGASVAFDSDEMIARHLEAAHGYRLELGPVDEHTGALALRSARCYLASARRALDRDELISAGTQAARGAALAAADSAIHAELLLVGCEAFLSAGDVAAGAPLVDDLDRIAGDALAPWATCYRCQFVVYTDPERLLEVDARLQGAIDEFGRRKDPAGLAKAHRVRAGARGRLGRIGDCEVDLFEALIAARQGGDHRQITAALGAAPSAALWGPSPVPKAGGRCLDVVRMQRMTTAAPSLEATSLRCLAVLELLRGRPDKARSMLADARQIVADLGLRHGLMETELFAGLIESMVGDQVAAEPHFRTAMKGMDALGVGADAGQAAALLARSVLAQGRVDEADSYAAESERLAGHNLKTAIAWRAVRAEILAAQGRHDEAVVIAGEAVAVAADTDLVLDHADACLAFGRVLAAAGDEPRAAGARRDAEALYAAKEAAISIARTIEPPAPATPSPIPTMTRLPIANRASEIVDATCLAVQAHDVEGYIGAHAARFVYDDRRRLSGDPVEGIAEFRVACERFLEQYSYVEWRTQAVRGDRLSLDWFRWWDHAGNEAAYFAVVEVDDDGLIVHHVRFDGDDFEGAYRELERRYYGGEGAAFAPNGHVLTEFAAAMDRLDVDAARSLAQPKFHWLTTPSALTSGGELSVDDLFGYLEERRRQVSSVRHWVPTIRWLSPNCCIGMANATAVGLDGEDYEWTRLYVTEYHDGLLASVHQFELDDEDAAFADADTLVTPRPSRLAIANRASEIIEAGWRNTQAHDVDATVEGYSEGFVYDDHRRLSGDPIVGLTAMRAALERIFEQYSQFQLRVLAVRGERLLLASSRWSDDAGNETSFLHVAEIDDEGRTTYDGRFDADDFNGAYRELERRYYTGEGAAFAEAGAITTESVIAVNEGDLDRLDEIASPGMRFENRSRSVFADRSIAEYRASIEKLDAMVTSKRTWYSTMCWQSPTCCISRMEREAVGEDGEPYAWAWIYVAEVRDGLMTSSCQFDLDDEDAAFAYAETLVTPRPSRLALSNRATEAMNAATVAMRARDAHAAMGFYADPFTFDDRRRLSGDPIDDHAGLIRAAERILSQYTRFEGRTLAVRGERLELAWIRWSDDAGNETSQLRVAEVDGEGGLVYEGRFDEDDFEGAYRELERRYYAGEGAAYAESGATLTEVVTAQNRGDLGRVFGELSVPELRIENRSSSAFPDRSAAELRASMEELDAMVASTRDWYSAVRWMSRNCFVARQDREAVGRDGEKFEWTRLYVGEIRGGLATSICEFDVEDEEAAFAYAEERITATSSRLAVTNHATEVSDRLVAVMNARDIDATIDAFSDQIVYDDRRRLSGDPIVDRGGLRAAFERIFEQYSVFESRTLAVRGQRVALWWSRWSDDSGNETDYLHVFELDDDGRIAYAGRFEEDDFESAYRELEQRYYAGEGAEFAEQGAFGTEWVMALNQGDFDRVFNELTHPFMRVENRSLSVFGDPSAAELRATFEELYTMVASARAWSSAMCWLSPTWGVARLEREAVGRDGEKYAWARLQVIEFRDGRLASLCRFEVDDEEAAFAYAEERARATTSRLAVTNRASEVTYIGFGALQARDIEAQLSVYSDQFVYDDRRRLSGHPIENRAELRAAMERIHEQYSVFEVRTLAVRGTRLHLGWSRWSDDSGNVTVQLHIHELGNDERIACEVRFDEDDFEGAYRELDRRYYAGEGSAWAEAGATATEWVIALNRGDFDRAFGELSTPNLQVENRSLSAVQGRSATDLRAATEELHAMVASVQVWNSAVCWLSPTWLIARHEREAIGQDSERYEWTSLLVGESRDARLASLCVFDIDNEERAFAYAEERIRATDDSD